MVEVAVCVATRRRPEGLRQLLGSLAAQDLPDGAELRVIVVENDDRADPAVAEAKSDVSLDLESILEPRRGIPFARNTAVSRVGDADVIAFIDDDEVAPRDWIARHLAGMATYGADVTTGPVLPRFGHVPPRWAVSSGLFDRRRWPTGNLRAEAYTGNAVCRAELLTRSPEPFETRLALTGGSDTELFRRLVADGARIVWLDDAHVLETVPPERTTIRWILRRGLRYGNDRWRRHELSGDTGPSARLATATAGVLESLAGAFLALVALPFSTGLAVRWLNRAARGWGAVVGVLGFEFEEYAGRASSPRRSRSAGR